MVGGVCLHPIRRKPKRTAAQILQRHGGIFIQWVVAWSILALCYMGTPQWPVGGYRADHKADKGENILSL